ncbi:MAG TPA: ComEA family DNA-binding protein [Thermoflexia bacterium]|nr:ComEA family DNA-binding protein [Thermoflexia bacterium]
MNSPLEQPQPAAEIRTEMRVEIRGYLVLATLVSLVIGGLIGYFTPRRNERQPVNTQLEPPPGWGAACVEVAGAGPPAPTATPQPLRVYLSGAVQEPQVVVLPADSLLADALAAVGGPLPTANLETLNLAAPLVDHQHVVIPATSVSPAATPRESIADEPPTTSIRLNINTATATELETLPGIGQRRAIDIIAYREAAGDFQQIEDIQSVSGIGESIFAKLAPLITVSE